MSKNRARLSSNDKRDGIERTPLRGLRPLTHGTIREKHAVCF